MDCGNSDGAMASRPLDPRPRSRSNIQFGTVLKVGGDLVTGTLGKVVFQSPFRTNVLIYNLNSQHGTVEQWNASGRFRARARIGLVVFHRSTVPNRDNIKTIRHLAWNAQIPKRSGSVPLAARNKIWGWNG